MKTHSLARFAPLALRIVFGIIFILHGAMKFAQMSGTIHFFGGIGIPFPMVAGPVIGLLEIVGGIALILGIGSRIFALLLAIDMIVAILTAKLHAGFMGGWEFELAIAAGLVTLFLSGPGALSIIRNKESLAA